MKDMIKRYFFFILGLIINSFGIAFITKSALGTSPISSVPYVFSLRFDGFSFGGFTFIMNMLFILLQVLLLRKNFQLIQLLQIGANFLFSAFIDVGMSALSCPLHNFDPLLITGWNTLMPIRFALVTMGNSKKLCFIKTSADQLET